MTEQNAATAPIQLRCGGRVLDLSRPRIMGVLNITPDSFSDGGTLYSGAQPDSGRILSRVEQMVAEGADIIDIGGESTRPGAAAVSLDQEMDRVLPVVEAISSRFDTIVSVDTSSPQLMLEAAARGAGLLNDVRALTRPGAVQAAAATGLPVCLMHMQGEPGDMQRAPAYQDVVAEVSAYLLARVADCQQQGLARANILLDPGFGFGKSVDHNLQLLNHLDTLVQCGFPVLVGLSRKSLIGKVLGREIPQRLPGSLALAALALARGATILRVHDVAAHNDLVRMFAAVAAAE